MAAMFCKELPTADVIIDVAEFGDKPVPFAIVGRPDAGVLSAVPGLEVVLSLNAGVEHLLASGGSCQRNLA